MYWVIFFDGSSNIDDQCEDINHKAATLMTETKILNDDPNDRISSVGPLFFSENIVLNKDHISISKIF